MGLETTSSPLCLIRGAGGLRGKSHDLTGVARGVDFNSNKRAKDRSVDFSGGGRGGGCVARRSCLSDSPGVVPSPQNRRAEPAEPPPLPAEGSSVFYVVPRGGTN